LREVAGSAYHSSSALSPANLRAVSRSDALLKPLPRRAPTAVSSIPLDQALHRRITSFKLITKHIASNIGNGLDRQNIDCLTTSNPSIVNTTP
jgi:hypothetical protein